MTSHRTLRRRGLPAANRVQDRPVLTQDRVSVDGRPHACHEQGLENVERPAGERTQELVARRSGDLTVEAGVGEPKLVRCLALAVVAAFLDRRLELCHGLVGRVRCCQPGERHLELDARFDELDQRDALGLEHGRDGLAEVAADPLVLRAGHEDAAAWPARGSNEMRACEQSQRLAQRRPAHPELGGELALRAEPIVGP